MERLSPDLVDLLTHLVDAGVEFVVLGGYAVAHYGHVRATKDLDVLVKPDKQNAHRTFQALAQFGAPIAQFEVKAEDFTRYHQFLQIGVPPNRIDILTKVDGIGFAEAIEGMQHVMLAGRKVPIIGKAALLKNKRASGRPQDLADVHALTSAS